MIAGAALAGSLLAALLLPRKAREPEADVAGHEMAEPVAA